MTDDGATFQPGAGEIAVPFRPRSEYVGYRAFGGGEGAVLVEPRITHELRSAAEFATQEGRVTGGLLYGRGWVDEQGAYLVVDGFLEAGPGENRGDRVSRGGADGFTLSEADLRLLRQDAARMYSASLEVGWWRALPALGEFGQEDFVTQAELVGPDGVGLLVYGSGIHWGTAYLGPGGDAPDSAGTLVATSGPDSDPGPPPDPEMVLGPEPGLETEPGLLEAEPGPEPEPEVVNIAAGESLLEEPLPPEDTAGSQDAEPLVGVAAGTAAPGRTRRGMRRGATMPGRARRGAAPGRTGPRAASRVRMPPRARGWAARPASAGGGEPAIPGDVQLVVIALAVVTLAAAIIVGVLVHSVTVAVIIAAVGLLVLFSTIWMARHS